MKDEYAVQSTGACARGEMATRRALLRYAARASKRCGLLCTPPRPTLADALADSHVAQWKYFLMITMALPKNNETKPSVITANATIFSVPMHSCGECPLFNSPRWYLHNMQ